MTGKRREKTESDLYALADLVTFWSVTRMAALSGRFGD